MENQMKNSLQKSLKHWWLLLVSGFLLVAAGVFTFTYPIESYIALSIVFSITFIVTGLSDITFSIINRKTVKGWGWSVFWGLINVLLGAFLIKNPAISMQTLPMYVGFTLMIRAIGAISFSQILKSFGLITRDPLFYVGVVGLILSMILIWNPVWAGFTIISLTGAVFIFLGVYQIAVSLKLKQARKILKEKVDLEIV
ncbi:DUF308 domain-containing protein [Flammeovirga yaeyamensis]|uniref:DUF308 domain-containing protein n=2 Tax=Flammeovirga yaeyamensis TaxID=367791 RepID=A0AAX1N513_9BACT|nr:DUF308 domain-containing protein [Flammeovirga yaeyamensis]MBB3699758.1 uncharacterized membrane protein HdeD (DUF308 family) [Flammeovirga yaeyamensis]NMF36673.1 HdeD family acid-resistance protein [Flammeovirga yaeyamensis]QWG02282.1 DUF308 domain-containing protein [Flammeovirga yaeyamensis]